MFVKNFLKPGDYLMPVPVGLPMTLQYNDKGVIEKTYIGWQDSKQQANNEFYSCFRQSDVCPMTISVKGGTTWISGVLYSKNTLFDSGKLPECIFESLQKLFIKDPSNFNFYAGNIESLATVFRGANPIVNWLDMSKFNVLPGWIIPSGLTKAAFYKMLDTDRFNSKFTYGLVSNYIVYRGSSVIYENTGIRQFVVSKVSKFIDSYGYIKCNVYSRDDSVDTVILNYSDVVKFNIQTNSLVVLDSTNSVLYTCCTDNKKREPRSKKISCDVCGKPFVVPDSGLVECPDPHCKSKWLPIINQMLSVFKLPMMTQSRFNECSSSLICIADVLSLDEYKDYKLNITLSDILEALVPRTTVSDTKVFYVFSSKCRNVIKTFLYYIHNPENIMNELEMSGIHSVNLVKWLSDVYNQSEVESLLDCPQVSIEMNNKIFDGPPIFRNKTIMITGSFKHGDFKQISAILRSYSADVTYEFSDKVDCVLIGDILENVNGTAVKNAQRNNVPVMEEAAFFKQYEIDEDLAENLV